ncbi:MAG: ATP-grasp domain-containing protein [Candidatus Bathyarchaeia archaeon]
MVDRGVLERKLDLLKAAEEYKSRFEAGLSPLEELSSKRPVTFISIGGGELGDLVVTAAKRQLGGLAGGIRTVVFDRYEGCPAQDAADSFERFDMMDGALLEQAIRRHVPDPREPHVIYLEIEKVSTSKAFEMGLSEGYRVMSTCYGPLICMDRYLTKLMFDYLKVPRVEWAYASSQAEIEAIASKMGVPLIVKPLMTSSGHGTSIVETPRQLEGVYDYAVRHARGIGNEVICEKFLPELRVSGTEVMQIVVRHFNEEGRIVTSMAPPVEHRRPAATYHESWLPSAISENAARQCQESARKIAEFIGGLGVYAVEQFVIGDAVYNNEVANRPHDTGMVTRWMLNQDEGALELYSTLGLTLAPHDLNLSRTGIYGVAHVILAPDFPGEEEIPVQAWRANEARAFIRRRGYSGDIWYFGKPAAYAYRRMGLAVGFHEDLLKARQVAEDIAHYAERCITYGPTAR